MPTSIAEILAAADELLESNRFSDYCVNGLQVPGPQEVAKIATAVSANRETFERTAATKADLLLVHHGLFWGSGIKALDANMKQRLELLFDANIALAAYHLPLDAHPDIGNNALLGRALGAERLEPFGDHQGTATGFLAHLPKDGTRLTDLLASVATATNREPLLLPGGPHDITRLAIVTGSGGDYIQEAHEAGAQALLTGEASERTTALAEELEVSVILAGHHATETFGIKALGELLASRFGIEHEHVEVENPL